MAKPSGKLEPGPGKNNPERKDPPAFPPLTFSRFIVEREIGRGRNSVVYRAVDPNDRAVVALKIIYAADDQATQRRWAQAVKNEAERLRLLSHPHIVGVREANVGEGRPYIVFPFIRGLSLDQALSAGTLNRATALAFLTNVALAVHYAHQQGLIHRDLKPNNILVGSDGDPYVLDFGLSWRKGEKGEQGIQSIVGTAAYMSPEQARGEEEHLTPATDVYSLGAILYEILTGRPPFAGETNWKTVQLAMHDPPKGPRQIDSSIDVNLERVVLWCLEKEPGKRYASAAALAEDLKRVAQNQPPQGPRHHGFLGRLFH